VNALIQENVALAPLTTLRIGGPARYFAHVADEESLLQAIAFAKERRLQIFVLGGGSNLLVADTGFSGLVVKIGIRGIDWAVDGERTILRAGAGEDWDGIVGLCVERGLAGIECLSGIPGSVGGTPVQNVGAYGQEVSEVLLSVRAYDRLTDQVVDLSNEDCRFTYRSSLFNSTAKDRYVVLRVAYRFENRGTPLIRYPDIQREFEGKSAPTLAEVRAAVRRVRARKAMLLVDGDPDCRSAGSFFKNPILTEKEFADLQNRVELKLPRYPASPGNVKTAAAWLIEQTGFSKGYANGPAGVSTKHTLALVNKGGARADDILRLAREIRDGVCGKFGIKLTPEPVFLGFEAAVYSEFFPPQI
jgi:UDP-N-acetylmuramate dehydrogenase